MSAAIENLHWSWQDQNIPMKNTVISLSNLIELGSESELMRKGLLLLLHHGETFWLDRIL